MVGAGAEGCFLIAFNLSMEMVGVKVKPTNLYVCGNSNFFKNIVIRAIFQGVREGTMARIFNF